MSIADTFAVSDTDTVWDAWLTTVNLMDMLEPKVKDVYNFEDARSKISKIYKIAESHLIDTKAPCQCGLSDAEHSLLKRKILTFYSLQVSNLRHFLS